MATTDPATLTARQKEETALSLRLGGATLAQAGTAVGLTPQGARAALLRALKRHTKLAAEEAEELRTIEVLRLDRVVLLASTLMADAKQPADTRLRAADRLIKAGEARARLLGFAAPTVLAGVDLSKLTDDQMHRIAKGESVFAVLSASVEPSLADPAPAHPAPATPADDEGEAEGEVVGDEVIF